jgi:PPOX class probable F420-dependent enzyme
MGTQLDDAPYISLMSFKRDGTGVATPVWTAPLDGKLVVFTNRDTYKVKRIGRNPKVRVARCDVRGNLLGPWIDGTAATSTDPAQQKRMVSALRAKYGVRFATLDFFAHLVGRDRKRVFYEIAVG